MIRLAYYTPLPPSKSGIADYSHALLAPLRRLADVTVFDSAADPAGCDVAVYQIGNNPYHAFAYETALRHPGITVLHEANLHHLVADLTIRRNDWDAYLRECLHDGGDAALAHARRVRALEVGPDYDGVPMLRRILDSSRAVIVHSRTVEDAVRARGFTGPIARIPHGAWIPDPADAISAARALTGAPIPQPGDAAPARGLTGPLAANPRRAPIPHAGDAAPAARGLTGPASPHGAPIPHADRNTFRRRLGLDEITPLIGAFGFLKPYKRIAESLRAFRRLVRVVPQAKMILVGEPHPDFPVHDLIHSLGLSANVRVLGFAPIDEFTGYMAACDIVLNLRYPTVGESSGSMLRALGLGKAVLVSEVGAFAEFPDDVCLKVPVGAGEEDLIFEYLNLLVSRPDVARAFGARARCWVERECSWEKVAAQYAAFIEAVVEGREYVVPAPPPPPPAAEPVAPDYVRGWAEGEGAQSQVYAGLHMDRIVKTLAITPPGGPDDAVLEMGAYLQMTPALKTKLGYGEVRGCYYGPEGVTDDRTVVSASGEEFACKIDLFDAEKHVFPYQNARFCTVLCCELIEHLALDPMHLMAEINRILKINGHLVLTTPNIAALRGVAAILQGYHPGFFHAYLRPPENGEPADARHNREYTPREIHSLLEAAGFEVTLLETGPFRDEPHPEYGWVLDLLERYRLPAELRGDGIYAVGRKTGPVRERYPSWLYG